jgi:hypothetical protein
MGSTGSKPSKKPSTSRIEADARHVYLSTVGPQLLSSNNSADVSEKTTTSDQTDSEETNASVDVVDTKESTNEKLSTSNGDVARSRRTDSLEDNNDESVSMETDEDPTKDDDSGEVEEEEDEEEEDDGEEKDADEKNDADEENVSDENAHDAVTPPSKIHNGKRRSRSSSNIEGEMVDDETDDLESPQSPGAAVQGGEFKVKDRVYATKGTRRRYTILLEILKRSAVSFTRRFRPRELTSTTLLFVFVCHFQSLDNRS